jgi:mRNA interferase RelE/StbE
MVYRIDIAKSASKQIASLETVVQKRLGKKIQELSEAENVVTSAKMLSGDLQGVYRVRIGDYRVLFDVHKDTLTILSVKHRKDVYRK